MRKLAAHAVLFGLAFGSVSSVLAQQTQRPPAPAPCPTGPGTVNVRMAFASERQDPTYQIAARLNAEGIKISTGETVCLTPVPMGSGDAVNLLKGRGAQAGPEEIHVVSPASDFYVSLINQELNNVVGIEGEIARTPVVLMAWKPVADRLRQLNSDVGWAEVLQKAQARELRYGQTSPERSNSGLTALVAQFYAGAARARGASEVSRIGLADVSNPEVQSFVKGIHEAVIHYGESTGFYVRNMMGSGPSFADVIAAYESDVASANATLRTNNPNNYPSLEAIYPREGTFMANHPFGVVRMPHVDAKETEAAKAVFAYMQRAQSQLTLLQYGFRPVVDFDLPADQKSALFARVFSAANGVRAIDQPTRVMRSPSAEVLRAILEQYLNVKKRARLFLILDTSGSMNETEMDQELRRPVSRIQAAIDASIRMVSGAKESTRVAVVEFNDRMTPTRSSANGPIPMTDANRQQLIADIRRLSPGGGTNMLDAISRVQARACQDMRASTTPEINVIVVMTDGLANDGSREREVTQQVGFINGAGGSQCRIPIFGIAFGRDADLNVLSRLSRATGGESAAVRDPSAFRRLLETLGELL